ncbi:hypothetical protein PN498_13225 [Oscillatoria sp. CS-180]|uniref:hypothetical protein n=1 Tax=Oscillatoria sp. CS-180 TaxID=3021720 RepID=UPI00233031F2|nr:hypothetical protein [Oscillatoria sp. CS-180]MDB9526955.1 hypothetical protein [Oscillatoria sp. CS-180]
MEHSTEDPDKYYLELASFRIDEEPSDPDDSVPEEEDSKEKSRRWSSNPLVHLAVVATVVATFCFGLYMLVGNIGPKAESEPPLEERDDTALSSESEGVDDGPVKTDLAFGQQSDDLLSLDDTSQENATETSETSADQRTATTVSTTSRQQSVPAAPIRRVSSSPPSPPPPPISRPLPVTPASAPQVTPSSESATVSEPVIAALPSPLLVEPEDTLALDTLTVISGETIMAELEQPTIIGLTLPLKTRLRLTEPLEFPQGEVVLPTGSVLIGEARTDGQQSAWIELTAAVIGHEEYPLPDQAVIAMGENGPWQRQTPEADNGLNLEQILLTGAIATLDLDQDDFLSGIVLDVLGQLSEREAAQVREALEAEQVWIIPGETEAILHINQSLELPVLETPSTAFPESTPNGAKGSEDINAYPAPAVNIALKPDTPHVIRFVQTQDVIVQAWVSDPTMVRLRYDWPLETGYTRAIYTTLKEDSSATSTVLHVLTASNTGKRRLHRFTLER